MVWTGGLPCSAISVKWSQTRNVFGWA
jgi:hypothetical protein